MWTPVTSLGAGAESRTSWPYFHHAQTHGVFSEVKQTETLRCLSCCAERRLVRSAACTLFVTTCFSSSHFHTHTLSTWRGRYSQEGNRCQLLQLQNAQAPAVTFPLHSDAKILADSHHVENKTFPSRPFVGLFFYLILGQIESMYLSSSPDTTSSNQTLIIFYFSGHDGKKT